MSVFFGTDGLRGVVNQELTNEVAFKCGNSISQLFENGGKVLVGRDTRITGSYLISSLAAGLMAGGVDVVDAGIVPTAGVAFLTNKLNFDYGIVVTASHNPREYNGIKIFSSKGEKIQDKDEEKIERGFIKTKLVNSFLVGKYREDRNLIKNYINYLVDSAPSDLKGLTIVLDASNGAAYNVAPKVFKKLGAKVFKVCCNNDGENINNECGSLHPNKLQKRVVSLGANFGFAFDGDADRLISVSEKGDVVDGDMAITALAKSFKKQGKLKGNAVVGTSQTNMGIERELEVCGIKLYRADVGDKYVSEILNKQGLSLGGEQSGHIIIKEFMQTGDGVLSAIQLACACKQSGKSMSNFTKVKLYPQTNINIEVKEKLRILGSEKLANAISNASQELAGLGRVLVRASGTEPKIRIMVESENVKVSKTLAKYLADVVCELEDSGE